LTNDCGANSQFLCADIDECAKDNGGCTEHSTCKNTPGSYECLCDSGYKAQGPLCVGQLSDVLLYVTVQFHSTVCLLGLGWKTRLKFSSNFTTDLVIERSFCNNFVWSKQW